MNCLIIFTVSLVWLTLLSSQSGFWSLCQQAIQGRKYNRVEGKKVFADF